jgi:hypothetical protein
LQSARFQEGMKFENEWCRRHKCGSIFGWRATFKEAGVYLSLRLGLLAGFESAGPVKAAESSRASIHPSTVVSIFF